MTFRPRRAAVSLLLALLGLVALRAWQRSQIADLGPLALPDIAPVVPAGAVPASAVSSAMPAGADPTSASPAAAVPPVLDAAAARQVLADLDARRAAGFADPARADPAGWAAPECSCLTADRTRLDALTRAGHRLDGAASVIVSVVVARAGPGWAELVVTDRLPAYVETATSAVVRRWAGREPVRWLVTIADRGTGWRFVVISRATEGGRGPPGQRVAR